MRLVRLLVLVAFLLPLTTVGVAALDVPPVPQTVPLLDQAEMLTPEQEQAIAGKIIAEEQKTGNQVGVLVIKSLQGESLEDYSLRVARGWGIGGKERNSGVLLLVAIDDRRLRIEVGYGLEGALPDARAYRIIDDRIKPAFRNGDYYKGIDAGIDGILLAIHNEQDPNLRERPGASSLAGVPWESILFFGIFIPIWLASMLARTKGWWLGGVIGAAVAGISVTVIGMTLFGILLLILLPIGGLILDFIVSRNYKQRVSRGLKPSWWAGGAHIGGGGNGGWGGFGGGSFGGGGASGSW